MYIIRAATVADAEGVAKVHVDSWRTTYRGFLPDEVLDNLSYESRAQVWQRTFSLGDPQQFAFVAESDGEVVGFVTGGPAREDIGPYPGEIYAVYLLADQHRRGIGRAMFEHARAALAERGYASFMLWVLEGNPTCGFYEHMGGKPIGKKQDVMRGHPVTDVAYGWL